MGTIWPVARNKNNNQLVVRKHKNANKDANQPVSTYQLKNENHLGAISASSLDPK